MRRRFFLFAAPAIVAAPSLMKISALAMPRPPVLVRAVSNPIVYGQSTLGGWYSGYEILPIQTSDVFVMTSTDWSEAARRLAASMTVEQGDRAERAPQKFLTS